MAVNTLQEKTVETAILQFIYPFSVKPQSQKRLKQQLLAEGYDLFSLTKLKLETAYYGSKHKVSHRNMERFFLPYTEQLLFPQPGEKGGIHRYSKSVSEHAALNSPHRSYRFQIHSIDILMCPFDLCFITLRIELTDCPLSYSETLDFADHFRVMEQLAEHGERAVIHVGKVEYHEIKDFMFEGLVGFLVPFLDREQEESAYFETLPFFVDERMFVQSFLALSQNAEINESDLFRAGHLNGFDLQGNPYVAATNNQYVSLYYQEHVYDRWAPDTFFVYGRHTFSCVTAAAKNTALVSQMYGEYYYGLLLYLFQKIVLYKLSYFYSRLDFNRDSEEMESLIRSITVFSSRYFFPQVIAQTQGREIFDRVSRQFGNMELYRDVKETLSNLFQNREKFSAKRNNYLLMILTIYTVITGILGMNLVIGDFEGGVDWNKIAEYSPVQYFALFIAVSGIFIGGVLGGRAIFNWFKDWWKEIRKREKDYSD